MLGAEAGLFGGVGECIPFEILVLQQPVPAVENFLSVGRGGKNLRQQLIRVERDRRNQIVDAHLQRRRTGADAGAAAWLCGGGGSADLQPVMMFIKESTTVRREAVPARRKVFIVVSSGSNAC